MLEENTTIRFHVWPAVNVLKFALVVLESVVCSVKVAAVRQSGLMRMHEHQGPPAAACADHIEATSVSRNVRPNRNR